MERQNMLNDERDNKNQDLEDVDADKDIRRGTLNISDFLGQIEGISDSIEEDGDNNHNENDSLTVNYKLKKKNTLTNDDDIIMEGYMEKKSFSG